MSPMVEYYIMKMSEVERLTFAKKIESFIKPIVYCISNGDYESAVNGFMTMNNYIRKLVNVPDTLAIETQTQALREGIVFQKSL